MDQAKAAFCVVRSHEIEEAEFALLALVVVATKNRDEASKGGAAGAILAIEQSQLCSIESIRHTRKCIYLFFFTKNPFSCLGLGLVGRR